MSIEIKLRIHKDYVTRTIFTFMLLNGWLVLVAPNFGIIVKEITESLNIPGVALPLD